MKRNIIFGLMAATIVMGCTDMLTQMPSDKISTENMWTSPSLAEKGMAGIYKHFYITDFSDNKGNIQINKQTTGYNRIGIEAVGFTTDYNAGFYKPASLSESTKKASDKQLTFEWKFGYSLIHAANDAIANLQKAGLDSKTFDKYMCEARFIRAWAYHRLNTLFLGVPLYESPVNNDDCTKGQAEPEEIWNFVLSDLKFCIENTNLPACNTSLKADFGRPSKAAAYALRGMVYMWKAALVERNLIQDEMTPLDLYTLADSDFEQVTLCGHGFWEGRYIDFFKPANETHKEMIWAIQFDASAGFCDNFQLAVGAWDTYSGWAQIKPSADFVDSYQNADGTKFAWSQVSGLENWDNMTVAQREVFFLRDGLMSEDWSSERKAAIERVGSDVFNRYYLNEGNQDRIHKAYENRDPRLLQTILPPYDPQDCYVDGINGNKNVIGKQIRHPFRRSDVDGGDIRFNETALPGLYMYRKYVHFLKDEIEGRYWGHTDWPLIRYTDVALQRAEALAHIGSLADAAAIVDQVRSRSNMPSVGVPGKEDLLEAIRYERRVELCVEAVNYFDEIRWGTYKQTKFQGKTEYGGQSWWGCPMTQNMGIWYYDECMWPWSAPLAEIQRNHNLSRREGWSY